MMKNLAFGARLKSERVMATKAVIIDDAGR